MRLVKYRGYYAAAWYEGGRIRRVSLRTKDREAAERALRDLQLEADRPGEGDTVGRILDAYAVDLAAKGKSDVRAKWATQQLRPTFGALRPDQIEKLACRRYVKARREAKISDGTIRRELGVLAAALRWHDPKLAGAVERPGSPPPRDRFLTREEYDALLAGCGRGHIRLFVILALQTAARSEALLQLRWAQIDFARGLIHLGAGNRTKGRATVPMSDKARAALEDAQKAAMSDYVIEWGGEQVRSIKMAFRRAAARAGLEGVTPHVLRHTAASWMAQAGIPMTEISKYLGHTSTAVTERVYAKLSPDYLRNAAKVLG